METQGITPKEEQRYAELQLRAIESARIGDGSDLAPMLQAGLPPDLADEKGNSLLMLAAYNGHLETTRLLIHAGADVDRQNDRGQTPLGGVAFKGYLDVAKILVASGADVNADNGGGRTPILFAAMFGRSDMVKFLLSSGADENEQTMIGLPPQSAVKLTGAARTLLRFLSPNERNEV